MPIFHRSNILLFRTEATYGTDPVPTGAAHAILAVDMKLMPMEGQDISRELGFPNMGAEPTIPVDVHSKLTFKVELAPSGSLGVAPSWGALLRACGCAQTIVASTSVTYNPVSSGHESGTFYFYLGSTLYRVTGARGTAKFAIKASGIPYIEFEFTGLFNAVAEGSRPTPTLTGFRAPLAASRTNTPVFTLGGIALVMREFTLDLGNQIETRFLINSESVMLVDRAEKVDITVEAEAMTLINPYALAAAQATQAIVLQQGVTAGNRATINVPMAQLQRPAGLEQSQNIVEWPLSLIPLANAGNDQWTLVLT
jgi:hypothetical protein